MKILLFLIPLLIGCSSQKGKSRYEELAGYEGKYEYIGNASLTLVASEMDTTLYAVIDDAKYPLNYVGVDSFTNAQDSPDTIANLNHTKKEITIENFLTYRHGMDCEHNNPESKGNELKMMESEDWVKHTLDLPMVKRPGKRAPYCSGCALTLGRLVEIATGEELESFARENLFGPMGITNYKWKFAPNQSSMTTFSHGFR